MKDCNIAVAEKRQPSLFQELPADIAVIMFIVTLKAIAWSEYCTDEESETLQRAK
jgi:hypothetical protein